MGLFKPARRSAGNYRLHGDNEVQRLRQIRVYRGAGLKPGHIRSILDEASSDAAGADQLRRFPMVTKEKWVEVMRAAGFTDEDMHRWHAQFEKSAPREHQEFLEFLHIPPEEVQSIRDWSRKAEAGG